MFKALRNKFQNQLQSSDKQEAIDRSNDPSQIQRVQSLDARRMSEDINLQQGKIDQEQSQKSSKLKQSINAQEIIAKDNAKTDTLTELTVKEESILEGGQIVLPKRIEEKPQRKLTFSGTTDVDSLQFQTLKQSQDRNKSTMQSRMTLSITKQGLLYTNSDELINYFLSQTYSFQVPLDFILNPTEIQLKYQFLKNKYEEQFIGCIKRESLVDRLKFTTSDQLVNVKIIIMKPKESIESFSERCHTQLAILIRFANLSSGRSGSKIQRFFGCTEVPSQDNNFGVYTIVTQFYALSLYDYVVNQANIWGRNEYYDAKLNKQFEIRDFIMQTMFSLLSALNELHTAGFILNNLNPWNVKLELIQGELRDGRSKYKPVITDLSCAEYRLWQRGEKHYNYLYEQSNLIKKLSANELLYIAPERIDDSFFTNFVQSLSKTRSFPKDVENHLQFCAKSDIYSWGLLLYFVVDAKHAFNVVESDDINLVKIQIKNDVVKGNVQSLSSRILNVFNIVKDDQKQGYVDFVLEMMNSCVVTDPNKRSSSSELFVPFEEVYKRITNPISMSRAPHSGQNKVSSAQGAVDFTKHLRKMIQ